MNRIARTSVGCLLMLLPGASNRLTAQIPASSSPLSSPSTSVEQQLDTLAKALRAMQEQMEQSREQMRQIQSQIDLLRQRLSAEKDMAPASTTAVKENAEAIGRVTEEVETVRSSVEQQQQTKVESASRLPVRFTGLILFQGFTNRGVVDQIDLPSSALLNTTINSHASTGASLRQTILGLEGTGPTLWGAGTSGRVSMDFFGGVTGAASSGPAGTVRLRTAAIAAEWSRDRLEASYETPLISPLSPDSLATVAQPALAWSGNLWTWSPQFAWKHTHSFAGGDRRLSLQLGLLDTQMLNGASNTTERSIGAGEASGQPSYETRVAFGSGRDEHRFEIGVGGLYGRQRYNGNERIDTWATTADWTLPLSARLRFSGELYRGRGVGSLGGGSYRDTVSYAYPNSTATYRRGLDAEGGWIGLNSRVSSRLQANAFIGQDSASGAELRGALPVSVTNPIFFYARNRSFVGNVIYRPWASFLISPEYRRLQSWPIFGSVNIANIYTLTFGYQF